MWWGLPAWVLLSALAAAGLRGLPGLTGLGCRVRSAFAVSSSELRAPSRSGRCSGHLVQELEEVIWSWAPVVCACTRVCLSEPLCAGFCSGWSEYTCVCTKSSECSLNQGYGAASWGLGRSQCAHRCLHTRVSFTSGNLRSPLGSLTIVNINLENGEKPRSVGAAVCESARHIQCYIEH